MKILFISAKLIFLFFCIPAFTSAQTFTSPTLNSAGNSASINGQSFDYSIGEMALVHTANSANIIVTQGLLQPNDINTGIADYEIADGQILVYPNPVDDFLNIDANLPSSGTLQLDVFDLNGKLINQKEIAVFNGNENTSLSFANMAAGNYVLKAVFQTTDGSYYRNFKIQKMK